MFFNSKKFKNQKGYTVIETMVSVSLFVVVITAGMSALLNANLLHKKSRNMLIVIDSLTFTMEDMSRNIRTGYNYTCLSSSDSFGDIDLNTPKDCATGWALAFEHQNGNPEDPNDQWAYKIESVDGGQTFQISKSTDSAFSWVVLNSDNIKINEFSGFSVVGTSPPPDDTQQPFVTMKLSGEITDRNVVSPFSLQTYASQRVNDISYSLITSP